jgi:hypothetical protein
MLDEITSEQELTVETIRDVLEALSADSTTHSLIMNPRTLDMYVYYPEDYSKTIWFNLEDEISVLGVNETRLYNITELYENWSPTTTTNEVLTTTTSSTTSLPTPTTTFTSTTSSCDYPLPPDPSFELVILVLFGGLGLVIITTVIVFIKRR